MVNHVSTGKIDTIISRTHGEHDKNDWSDVLWSIRTRICANNTSVARQLQCLDHLREACAPVSALPDDEMTKTQPPVFPTFRLTLQESDRVTLYGPFIACHLVCVFIYVDRGRHALPCGVRGWLVNEVNAKRQLPIGSKNQARAVVGSVTANMSEAQGKAAGNVLSCVSPSACIRGEKLSRTSILLSHPLLLTRNKKKLPDQSEEMRNLGVKPTPLTG